MFSDKIQNVIIEFLKNRNSNKEPSKFKLYLISKFKKYIYPILFKYEYGKLWLADFLWENSNIFRILCKKMYVVYTQYVFRWRKSDKIYNKILYKLYIGFENYFVIFIWFYDLYTLQWYFWFWSLAIAFFVGKIRSILHNMSDIYYARVIENFWEIEK
jgi:hypothetical protein